MTRLSCFGILGCKNLHTLIYKLLLLSCFEGAKEAIVPTD
jgi:hypothetical protein